MNDITDLFRNLIIEHRSIDIANAEFHRMVDDSPELGEQYSEWCEENGYNENKGFLNFCEEYLESQDSIWESLNDYNDYDEY